jgi:hypothetical protein
MRQKGDNNTLKNEGTEAYNLMYDEDKSKENKNLQGLGEPEQPNLDATMMDSNLTDLHEYNTKATGSKEELVEI